MPSSVRENCGQGDLVTVSKQLNPLEANYLHRVFGKHLSLSPSH